jgi:hypothetical protein
MSNSTQSHESSSIKGAMVIVALIVQMIAAHFMILREHAVIAAGRAGWKNVEIVDSTVTLTFWRGCASSPLYWQKS